MATDQTTQADGSTLVVPVISEQVHVGVQQVDTGRGVRIHKTVTEQAHPIAGYLLRETVKVSRVPVDRIVALSDAPLARQEGDTWIVPICEEILVVEKRLRIKEEVHITRTAQAEPYKDTVVLRTENVTVERFDERPERPERPEPTESPDNHVNSSDGGNHHAAHTRSGI